FTLAALNRKKEIDLVFVVDNSGSMAEEQAALAQGFDRVAQTYFRNPYVDVCVIIISSDRYLGRTQGAYQRERTVKGSNGIQCTSPAGSESWTASERQAHLDAFIADFKTQIQVGTWGGGIELLGKSLVTFLHDQET